MDIKIDLWDYQQDAIDNMFGNQGIYTKGDRIAEVILPTGAGKSFVAMQSVLNVMNLKDIESIVKDGVISDTSLCYLAPNNLILYQFRLHLARYVMEKIYAEYVIPEGVDIEYTDYTELDGYVEQILDYFKIEPKDIKRLDSEEIINLTPREIIMKTVDKNVCLLSSSALRKLVTKTFPKFDFRCYQSTKSNEEKNEPETITGKKTSKTLKGEIFEEKPLKGKKAFKNVDAEFVILDEAHRGGAPEWKKAVKEFILEHKDTKILGITATPDRSADDEDLLDEIAMELGQREYVAQKIYLLEAMESGMVVTPEVKFFPFLLDESKEYLTVMNNYLNACRERYKDSKSQKASAYRIILEEMHKAMGMDAEMSNKLLTFSRSELESLEEIKSIDELSNRGDWEIVKARKIDETLYPEDNENPNKGKTIVFIPPGNAEESAQQVIDRFKEKFKKLFSKDKISLLKPYHSIMKSQNNEILREFNEIGNDEESGITAIITNKMADEGFHPDNIRNLVFMDSISAKEGEKKKKATGEPSPKAVFFQKIGRVIFGILGKDESEYKIPRIYDFTNNFGRHRQTLIDKEEGKNIFNIPRNIQYFFDLAEIGMRKDIKQNDKMLIRNPEDGSMKRLNRFYGRAKGEVIVIDETDCSNPENTEVLGYTNNPSKTKVKRYDPEKEKYKFELLIDVLEQLKKFNIDYTEISNDTVINKEFFKNRDDITEEMVQDFYDNMKKLGFSNMDDRSYFVGESLDIFRKAFWRDKGISSKFKNVYNDYTDYEKLVDLGIINVDLENIPESLKNKVRPDGFIMVNECFPEHTIGINVKTGKVFDENGKDEYGCREDGLDDLGYDRYGFDNDGFHRKTKCKYDERYFFRDEDGTWKNIITGTELDVFGYNHDNINPKTGFDRGDFEKVDGDLPYLIHLWHKDVNGTFSRVGKVYAEDEDGNKTHDFNGFESGSKARLVSSGSIKDGRGFYRDRTNGESSYYVYDSNLDMELDINRVSRDGFHFPVGYKKGDAVYNVYTSSPYDRTGKNWNQKYPTSVDITLEICKDLLGGKNLNEIKDNMKISDENLDLMICKAYEHFLKYKLDLYDDDIKKIYEELKNNKECVSGIEELSPTLKRYVWDYAESMEKSIERKATLSPIVKTMGGGRVKIEQSVNNKISQADDAESR